MKIVYTPQARADLKEVRDYIHNTLQNPTAAQNITNRIIKTCHILSDDRYAGFSLHTEQLAKTQQIQTKKHEQER